MGYRAIWPLLLFFALVPFHSYSQTPLTTTRDDLQQKLDFGKRAAPVAVDSEFIAPSPAAESSLPTNGGAFELNQVVFKNLSTYDPEDLRELWKDYSSGQVTLRELAIIANRIQDRYRADGYLATRVLLEPQKVVGGVVVLSVFEGRLANVTITSDLGSRGEAIRQRILSLNNQPGALKTVDLERALLLVRDIPGINISARLVPNRTGVIGGLDLELDVIDDRLSGFANLQNPASEETGIFLGSVGLDFNGVFAPADRLRVIGLAEPLGPEQINGLVEYEIRPQVPGISGLALRTGVSYGVNNPRGELEPLDLDGENLLVFAEAEYPIVRSSQKNLAIVLGADYSRQKSESGDIEIIDDTVAAIYGELKGNLVTNPGASFLQPGVATASVEVRRGIGGSDAGDENLSRFEGGSDFTTVRANMSYAQPLFDDLFELYFDARGQLSDSPLLAFDELSLGSLTIGRGFDPGVLSGDDGYAGTVELRVRPPAFSNDTFQKTEFFGFYDAGVASNQDSSSLGEERISSLGLGFRAKAPQLVEGSDVGGAFELTYAQPLEPALSTTDEIPEGRVILNLSVFW